MVWLAASLAGVASLVYVLLTVDRGWDLYAYWSLDLADIYGHSGSIQGHQAFLYSPPMALLMAPLRLLSWEVMVNLWLAAQLAALWVIAGRWAFTLLLFPPVLLDVAFGNINVFLAAVIVGPPAGWAFALLTKVTPGVGLVWFVVRREWRALAVAGAVTIAAVAVSLAVLGPEPWADWFAVLAAGQGQPVVNALPVPFLVRLPLAVAVVAYAAWTDRRWLLPVGVVLAMPVWWPIAFAPLVSLAAMPGGRWSWPSARRTARGPAPLR